MAAAVGLGLLSGLLVAPVPSRAAEPGISPQQIRIGVVLPLSGERAAYSSAWQKGFDGALKVAPPRRSGPALQPVYVDTAGPPQRVAAVARELLNEGPGVFGLTGIVGSEALEALASVTTPTSVPLIGIGTDADLKSPHRSVVFLRSGLREQLAAMVLHMDHVGHRDIAVVASADAFGQFATDALNLELSRLGMRTQVPLRLDARPTTAQIDDAVRTLQRQSATAVVVVLGADSTAAVAKAARSSHRRTFFYVPFDSWLELQARGLARDLSGAAVALGLPSVRQRTLEVVEAYRQSALRDGVSPSSAGLEGWATGRAWVEALRRCPPEPTRVCVVDAFDAATPLDLGGHRLAVPGTSRRASRFVELAIVGQNGETMR